MFSVVSPRARKCSLFLVTDWILSPTYVAKLSSLNGALLTPPKRSVTKHVYRPSVVNYLRVCNHYKIIELIIFVSDSVSVDIRFVNELPQNNDNPTIIKMPY